MTTSTQHLTNLTVIVDNNGLQVENFTRNIKDLGDLRAKWESFGFDTTVIDGHDYQQLLQAFQKTKEPHERPMAIIANTIKGKGVSFAENQIGWHKGDFTEETYQQAMRELKEEEARL